VELSSEIFNHITAFHKQGIGALASRLKYAGKGAKNFKIQYVNPIYTLSAER
jgi:hypothetical protein